MPNDLVSVIIPVFNRPELLVEAVQSVLRQTYKCVEIIIVNDGSTDHTGSVAEDLQRDSIVPISVLHQANSGPGAARQRGLEQACGEYIQFLDSDDLLFPGKFSAQVAALKNKPECGISYGPSAQENHAFHPPRRDWPMRATGQPISHLFPRLLIERWWTTSSPLYRSSLLATIGPWQPWINEEDWEYDSRCGATGTGLAWVEEPCSIRRIHLSEDNLSDRGGLDPRKLAHRARARQSLFHCALVSGVTLDSPEMKHFSRSAFLLSRQCAEAGLEDEACDLQQLSRKACEAGKEPADLRFYGWIGPRLGWRRTARLSQMLRALRPRRHGAKCD
jgi:glycosyltransferase involved in cell wall biosynthesis